MKTRLLLLLLAVAQPCVAFDHYGNPDHYPSIGLDVSSGKLPGMLTTLAPGQPATNGGFVKGLLDLRYPLTDVVTVHAFGSSTGVNNNLQFSGGNEVGIGLRIYLR